jgi:tetratricopeptide (TPR) repeat protein
LEIDPLHADAHLNLAHFHVTQRRHADAVPHLEIYLKHGTDAEKQAEAERLLGEIRSQGLGADGFAEANRLIRAGEEERGLAEIDGFLAAHGSVWQATFLRGWALRRLARYAEASREFETTVATAKERGEDGTQEVADVYNELAICQLELKDFAGAASSLREALRRDPDNTKILSNMGILEIKRGDLDEARRYFETILALDPQDPLAKRFIVQLNG